MMKKTNRYDDNVLIPTNMEGVFGSEFGTEINDHRYALF